MTRERLASALTRLISGGSRVTTGLAALVLTGMVLLAGSGLAAAARGLGSQLAGSEILARLTGFREPAEPGRAAAFLRYLNAMAPAVLNLAISPEEQVSGFNTIYAAARKLDVTLRRFEFDAEGQRMSVTCTAEDEASAGKFYRLVKTSAQFSSVDFSSAEESKTFTISCVFQS